MIAVRVVALAVVTAFASVAGAAAEEPSRPLKLKRLSPDGADACFGRIYDKAHLASHPKQKVERIYFFYGGNPASRPNEEPPTSDNSYDGFLTTTTRGARKPEWMSGWCSEAEGRARGRIHCGMDCDRTLANLDLDEKGRLRINNLSRDVYLDASDEEELSKAEYQKRRLGEDDADFVLDRMPAAQCKAEFARIDPIDPALGAPLRERLKPDEAFCYGRDYDARHLAKHPEQLTATIRVSRGEREVAAYASKARPKDWPNGAELRVSVTTRAASAASTQLYSCYGEGDAWSCSAVAKADGAGCDLGSKTIYLRRGANGTMMLANPASGLPIVDLCATSGATRSDDRVYRLSAMPQSACTP